MKKSRTLKETSSPSSARFFSPALPAAAPPCVTFELAPGCLSIMRIYESHVVRAMSGRCDKLWMDFCSTPEKERVFLMTHPLCNTLEEIVDNKATHPKSYILELNVSRDAALTAMREGRFSDIIIRAEQLLAVTSNIYAPHNIKFIPGKAAGVIAPIISDDSTTAPFSPVEQQDSNQSTTKLGVTASSTIKGCILV